MRYDKLILRKRAVIPCAGGVVGSAIARLFARHGAQIALGLSDIKAGEELLNEIRALSPMSFAFPCDLRYEDSTRAFCSEVIGRWSTADVLVNYFYVDGAPDLLDSDESADDLLFQVYQRTLVLTARAFWPGMLSTGSGAVVNISCSENNILSAAGSGTVGGFTRIMAVEGGPRGVRANEIIISRRNGADVENTDAACVAGTALFLASGMGEYTSGATIRVGGLRGVSAV